MAKKFIRQKNNATVYYRQGDKLRPISSIADFARLNSGSADIDSVTDLVDNFQPYHSIGSTLTAQDIDGISKGLSYNPLSTEERNSYLESAKAYYQPSRDAFGQLIKGKIGANELDFTDTKNRLKKTMDSTIAAGAQDLSNRGFLRSGEQIGQTETANTNFTTDVGRADIQRAITQANLLLEEAGFNADIDKSAQALAEQRAQGELQQRATDTAFARDTENSRLAAEEAERERADKERDRAYQERIRKIELAKAYASGGSGSKAPLYDQTKATYGQQEDGDGISFMYDGKPVSPLKYAAIAGQGLSGLGRILSGSSKQADKDVGSALSAFTRKYGENIPEGAAIVMNLGGQAQRITFADLVRNSMHIFAP